MELYASLQGITMAQVGDVEGVMGGGTVWHSAPLRGDWSSGTHGRHLRWCPRFVGSTGPVSSFWVPWPACHSSVSLLGPAGGSKLQLGGPQVHLPRHPPAPAQPTSQASLYKGGGTLLTLAPVTLELAQVCYALRSPKLLWGLHACSFSRSNLPRVLISGRRRDLAHSQGPTLTAHPKALLF